MSDRRLTGAEILALQDLVHEDVSVPEWGAVVRIRALTGLERDRYEESLTIVRQQGKKQTREAHMANARAKLVALCAINEDGTPLFERAQVDALGAKSAAALDRLFDAALRLSGLKEAEVEELGKNSESGDPSAASTSA